jgi:hypothetical protein
MTYSDRIMEHLNMKKRVQFRRHRGIIMDVKDLKSYKRNQLVAVTK